MAMPGVEQLGQRPLEELVQSASQQAVVLAREQVDVARHGLTARARQAGPGVAMVGGGAVLAALASGTGTAALVLLLARRSGPSAAALGVTGAYAGAGALLVRKGLVRLREAAPPLPDVPVEDEPVEDADVPLKTSRLRMPTCRLKTSRPRTPICRFRTPSKTSDLQSEAPSRQRSRREAPSRQRSRREAPSRQRSRREAPSRQRSRREAPSRQRSRRRSRPIARSRSQSHRVLAVAPPARRRTARRPLIGVVPLCPSSGFTPAAPQPRSAALLVGALRDKPENLPQNRSLASGFAGLGRGSCGGDH